MKCAVMMNPCVQVYVCNCTTRGEGNLVFIPLCAHLVLLLVTVRQILICCIFLTRKKIPITLLFIGKTRRNIKLVGH